MTRTVYRHPDGFTLAFNDNALTVTDIDGKAVSLPIGLLGLVELAEELSAIGNDEWNLAEHGCTHLKPANHRENPSINKAAKKLADNLLIAAKIALGAEDSTPSPTDRKRLYDAVVAAENACVKKGTFNWNNAGCAH